MKYLVFYHFPWEIIDLWKVEYIYVFYSNIKVCDLSLIYFYDKYATFL